MGRFFPSSTVVGIEILFSKFLSFVRTKLVDEIGEVEFDFSLLKLHLFTKKLTVEKRMTNTWR